MSDTVPPGGGDSEGGKDPDVTGHGDLHGTQGGCNEDDTDDDAYESAKESIDSSDDSDEKFKDPLQSPDWGINPTHTDVVQTRRMRAGLNTVDGSVSSGRMRQSVVSGFLQVRVKQGSQDLYTMHVQVPFLWSPQTIDWTDITEREMTSNHIRCLELLQDTDISEIVKPLESTGIVQCFVLIHHRNKLDQPILPQSYQCSVPILLVVLDGGKQLLGVLRLYGRSVEAKVELFSSEHEYSQQRFLATKEEKQSFVPRIVKQGWSLLWPSARSEHSVEVTTLLFPNEGRTLASEDSQLFQLVMAHFCHYEHIENHDTANQAISILADRCRETIHRDFPFYIVLVHRVCTLKAHCYRQDIIRKFHRICTNQIEQLSCFDIATSLLGFLSRKDFDIRIEYSIQDGTSVFQFLKTAMHELMTERKDTQPRSIHRTMLWVTLYLRMCVQMTFWKVETGIWHENFMKDIRKYNLEEYGSADLKNAVALIQAVKLPSECTFNAKLISQLLISTGYCQFLTQIQIIQACESAFDCREDFLQYNIAMLREEHLAFREKYPEESMKALRIAHYRTLSGGMVAEGFQYLNTLMAVMTSKKWKMEQFNEEIKLWLLFLLEFIHPDLKPLQALKKMISEGGVISSTYTTFIIQMLTENLMTRKMLLQQPLETFSDLCFPTIQHWPIQFLEDYLDNLCKAIPAYGNLSLRTREWGVLFCKMTERFQHACQQKKLCTVLMMVANQYKKRHQCETFITDLILLRVPKLLFISGHHRTEDQQTVVEYQHSLEEFIRNNVRKNTLLNHTYTSMSNITDEKYNCFQEAVLAVVVKEITPDLEDLQDGSGLNPYMKTLLNAAVTTLKCDWSWVGSMPSLRQTFCLAIVNICCRKISPVSYDQVNWIKDCKTVFLLVTSPFTSYSQLRKSADIPAEATKNPSKSVQIYFQWIQNLHQILLGWKKNLQSEDTNYDIIHWYSQNYQQIETLSEVISAKRLLVTHKQLVDAKQRFSQTFEQLNRMLIKYIPTNPSAGWCSLVTILYDHGVEIPESVYTVLHSYVAFPNEAETKTATMELLVYTPSSPKKFGAGVYLRISKKLNYSELNLLVKELANLLKPIGPSSESLLVYFKLFPSELFSIYLHQALNSLRIESMKERAVTTPFLLNQALAKTQTLLQNLLNGTATYHEMTAEGSLLIDLKKLDVEEEFKKLTECPIFNTRQKVQEDINRIKNLLKLIQSESYIKRISNVCQQYQLHRCSQDSELKELLQIAVCLGDDGERSKLTPVDSKPMWAKVCKFLCLKNGNMKCLDLFSKVEASTDFYSFLSEKQFVGTNGETRFYQQLGLITAQLQHEEYSEMVLNHLYAAFKFIAPFMDPKQTFHSFMATIAALEVPSGLIQLETVKNNMHVIRYWFSRAEDTLENVSNELSSILTSGCYRIFPSSASGRIFLNLILEYTPSSALSEERPCVFSRQTSTSSIHNEDTDHDTIQVKQLQSEIHEKLTADQLNDLVQKLGFLDSKGDEESKIRHFQHLNETAHRLLELFSKLKELGHPSYSDPNYTFTLKCSITLSDANKEVTLANKALTEWINEVEDLHSHYKWLLFFHIPKLINLHELLMSQNPSVSDISYQVSFLFKRDTDTRKQLKESIASVIASEVSRDEEQGHPPRSPMDVVGSFLDRLFDQKKLSQSLLPRRCLKTQPYLNSHLSNVLHSAIGYSQSMLIGLIITIYKGSPEAFEILHCKSTTTEQDLKLFIKRMLRHPRQYLILEVNKLPFQLQEILLQLYLECRQDPGNTNIYVHFIETAPSVLREVPWLKIIEYKEGNQIAHDSQIHEICQQMQLEARNDISCLSLVYGLPGDGKTHYIRTELEQVDESHQVTITINEAFSTLTAIERLCSLPRDAPHCAIFFNFTMVPPVKSAHEKEKQHYRQLIEEVGWFFLSLLVLGYVEDIATGKSFHFPGDLSWAIYIEVPSRHITNAWKGLECFREEVPTLGFVGSPLLIDSSYDYCIDDDVQLVCKYLQAYKDKTIDTLYDDNKDIKVKFSLKDDIDDAECQRLLLMYMPECVRQTKITQKLFIKYMKRRCVFLDNLPDFNFNNGIGVDEHRMRTDTRKLGSTLMKTMLQEVADFCDPTIKNSWSEKPHQQLIYDFKDGGGSLGLISLNPDKITTENKVKFTKIGVHIPSMTELYCREFLDHYLSRALNVPLKGGRLLPVDEQQYVLTLDYAMKMLNIHERYECGIPVIIEGETGVGKTALISMLAELWNQSWITQWEQSKSNLVDLMEKNIQDLPESILDASKRSRCMETLQCLKGAKEVSEEALEMITQLPCHSADNGRLSSVLNNALLMLEEDQLVPFVMNRDAFATIKQANCSDVSTAHVLYLVFGAKIQSTFHKLNVHAALQPIDVQTFFEEISTQANVLQLAYNACDPAKRRSLRVPFVTAYMDEINTSSCLGLLKEIIIDRTIDGKPLPTNIFIIAACNPHRGDILSGIEDHESWIKGTYYVHKLHPTLQLLVWDYGSLNQSQEREYIGVKMKMLNQRMSVDEVRSLTDVIVESQKKMRQYASEQLQTFGVNASLSLQYAKSSVSQRDIQRVFTFYKWLMKVYRKFDPHKEAKRPLKFHRRAVMVSLGIVYYMRLSTKYRDSYKRSLDRLDKMPYEKTFSQAFDDELNWFIQQVELPPGIAKTQSLKENVFATIACTMTKTPLIIVGAPGSSKTLSFNIVITNVKGRQSRKDVFRDTELFNSLDPHFYQCSRRTTSNEIEKVFGRAINRQRSLANIHLPVSCVVFMDEAGLPEEKLESLKALHYHLDRQEVAFVAISNNVLDAAKSNRAVSLFRPKATKEELLSLAQGCITSKLYPKTQKDKLIETFCQAYKEIQEDQEFKQFFGLRDFIHFVIYLRRKRQQQLRLSLVVEALERNFNGTDRFSVICDRFLNKAHQILRDAKDRPHYRNILEILKDSLADYSHLEGDEIHNSIQSEVRYKLIIDPSEDDSLVRLLFTCGVLKKETTRLYICSAFPNDNQLRVNTIAQIRHSIEAGHTILMCQTDEIHESFYDVFNQHFRTIEDPQRGARYYANIAIGAHSKPCRVDPKFQCVIVIKQSDLSHTPRPFLNRFEKYYLTHESILKTILNSLPQCIRIILLAAQNKVAKFVQCVEEPSFYGYSNETLESLMLSILPSNEHICGRVQQAQQSCAMFEDTSLCILENILHKLCNLLGFHIILPSSEEMKADADHIFGIVLKNEPEFGEVLRNMNRKNVTEIVERVHFLLSHSQGTNTKYEYSIESCLLITVLMQWLVGYLCKRLMQVMTPEALAVHCSKIPTAYLKNYFRNQEHFSFKELVRKYLQQLQSPGRTAYGDPTKLLLFTRSSPLIHQFPTEYPYIDATDGDKKLLEKYVFPDLDCLMLCKISLGHSQSKIQTLLSEFVSSNSRSIFVFVMNMQEVTKKMVNHLRIMIEEAERQAERLSKQSSKLFVLLLHFPPVNFFKACYPTFFLHGWDHYYLDTIACATQTKEAIVNIKDWFCHCCSIPSQTSESEMDTAVREILLPEAVPILASRVFFASTVYGTMNVSEKTEFIETLLFDRELGDILSTKFCTYWKPKTKVEQLQQVSKFMYDQESTLNITDSIQSIIQSAFFDFLVLMFTKMSENHVIHTLYDKRSPLLVQLILGFIRVFPVPSLAQLKIIGATVRYPHDAVSTYLPKFPFFKYVCGIVENAVDESRQEVNEQYSVLDTVQESDPMVVYCEQVTTILESKLNDKGNKSCLKVAIEAFEKDSGELWQLYLQDFIHYMLHLEISPLTEQILQPYIAVEEDSDVLTRLVKIHVYLRLHKLDLAKVERILKPISKIQPEANPAASVSVVPLVSSSTLAALVVDVFFNYISYLNETDSEKFEQWYGSYRDIMSIPGMMEDLMTCLTCNIERQLNVMHAAYLIARCCCDSMSSSRGLHVFKTLNHQHNEKDIQGPCSCPHLRDIMDVQMETLRTYPPQKELLHTTVKTITECLLDFFSSKHPQFSDDDTYLFLEGVNQLHFNDCALEEDPTFCPISSISTCQCKLYLTRVLGDTEHDREQKQETGLLLHDQQRREIVGNVLIAHSDLGCPAPYIPEFYQHEGKVHILSCEASKNALMQVQPLSHLYFLTMLEHLQDRKHGIHHLIRLAKRITIELENDSTLDPERILLFIEKQAIIQVLIQQLSEFFDSSNPKEIHDLFSDHSADDVNQLLGDESMGGSNTTVSGHGLVLALYLQKQLNSPTRLLKLLRDDHSTLVRDIPCVKPLQTLIVDLPKTEVHLFPFLCIDESTSELGEFYREIYRIMTNIHNQKGIKGSVEELRKFAQQSCNSDQKMKFSSTTFISKKNAFRMLLWLCAYYKFFDKKRQSKVLADAIDSGLRRTIEPQFIHLLKSFLCPKHYMISAPETPNPSVRMQMGTSTTDPVFELFNTSTDTTPDQSDVQLRHAMANMVAIVVASPPRSNHLWYHMFAADGLPFSYMTGFLYSKQVCQGGYCYDCGTELSKHGGYGKTAYTSVENARSSLSLHSLYLVLWANFSAFCIALLTQPDAQEKIKPLFSHWQPLRHYCMAKARSVWLHMSSCLQLSPDERSFFVMKCMHNLLEVITRSPECFEKGKFDSLEELKHYEMTWHEHIFKASFSDIHGQFKVYCQLMEVTLLKDLSAIEAHYPHYPSMNEFFQTLMSSPNIATAAENNELHVLSKFALEYPRLLTAGKLLPDLLELYQWLHSELAYLVTRKYAQNHTIEDVITKIDDRHPELKRFDLYDRVRVGYNQYVDEIGGVIGAGPCQNEGKILHIDGKVKFLHFLSDSDEGEGNDWLYMVISHIIKFHNNFLRDVFSSVTSEQPELSSLRNLLPENLEEYISPSEVNTDVMIINRRTAVGRTHMSEDLLQLVRSRYLQPSERAEDACPFDLLQLQKDVLEAFIVGKPLIHESAEDVRVCFQFKEEQPLVLNLGGAALNLSSISECIKKDSGFRESLPLSEESQLQDPRIAGYVKELEYAFHTADCQTLLEVVSGLRIVCEHLMTRICPPSNISGASAQLVSISIPEFLLSVYKHSREEKREKKDIKEKREDIMNKIGMKHLTQTQMSCLCSTELPYLYSTLEVFIQWIQDGVYDFCKLPLCVKKHISSADHAVLRKIPQDYQGAPDMLHKELQDLTEALVHSESHLCGVTSDTMQTSIMDFLSSLDLYGIQGEQLAKMIPNTILCQHYVALRVQLRQLTRDGMTGLKRQERWPEIVSDLWEAEMLKHLRDGATTYTTNVTESTHTVEKSTAYGFVSNDEEEDNYLIDPQNDDCEDEMPSTVPSPGAQSEDQKLCEEAKSLTITDVAELLRNWNLQQYVGQFSDTGVDGALLLTFSLDDLKDIGVKRGFQAKMIYTKFRQYLEEKKAKVVL